MTSTIFYESVKKTVDGLLIPVARDLLLDMANRLLRGRCELALSIGESSTFDASVSRRSASRFEVSLTRGTLYRLCFATQIFLDAFAAARDGTRLVHASFIQPFETAFIEPLAAGLTALNFSMCEPLRIVFTDSPTSAEQWDQLKAFEWRPFGYPSDDDSSTPGSNLLSQRTLSERAIRLAIFAVSFLVLHEFAHVKLGHLHYLDSAASLKAYPESGPNRNALDARTFQALEIDADIEALAVLLLIS